MCVRAVKMCGSRTEVDKLCGFLQMLGKNHAMHISAPSLSWRTDIMVWFYFTVKKKKPIILNKLKCFSK